MKKLLYIVSFIGLSLTFQSCDRLSGLLGGESDNELSSDTIEKVAATKMQSQLQRNEDGIKKLMIR